MDDCNEEGELAAMSNLMSGARILLECLARENVEVIFGYPGGVTLPLYDALYEHPIRHVLVRHEENASFAASGLCAGFGAGGRVLRDFGPRSDQPDDGAGGRDDGLDSGGGDHGSGHQQDDRQRRVSGSRHVRHHAVRRRSTITWCGT